MNFQAKIKILEDFYLPPLAWQLIILEFSNEIGADINDRGGGLFCFVFVFLGPHPRHVEVPRLGVELEL